MSDALLTVYFPSDGTRKWSRYRGSSDTFNPALVDNPTDAWEERPWPDPTEEPGEPVLIYSDYGGGSWWPGTATRDRVTSLTDVLDIEEWHNLNADDPRPEWIS